jgi:hypothetical protein
METWDVIAIFIFIWIYFLPSVIAIETDKKNTQHKYGKHAYSLSDFNISKEQVLTDFDFYLKRFNIQDDESKI